MSWLLNICKVIVERIYRLDKRTQTILIVMFGAILAYDLVMSFVEFEKASKLVEPDDNDEFNFISLVFDFTPWLVIAAAEIPLVLIAWGHINGTTLDLQTISKQSITVVPTWLAVSFFKVTLIFLLSVIIIPAIVAQVYYSFVVQALVINNNEKLRVKQVFEKSAEMAKPVFRVILIMVLSVSAINSAIPLEVSETVATSLFAVYILLSSFMLTVLYYLVEASNMEKVAESAPVGSLDG